jgi:ribosomal protein S18 acetylase RimI-like enzyme
VISYENAVPADLPAITELFQNAFPEALLAVFGNKRLPPAALLDLLEEVYACEREGFWVARQATGEARPLGAARDEGRLAGFILVTYSLGRLYRRLIFEGTLGRMARRWVTGRYAGLGFAFVPRLAKLWWDYRKVEKRSVNSGADVAQILSIVVDPAQQRRGIGEALTEKAIHYLRGKKVAIVRLEVDAAKIGPVRLYEKLGFKEVARLPTPRGPALVMTLHLIQ